jgi:hypothetical protein
MFFARGGSAALVEQWNTHWNPQWEFAPKPTRLQKPLPRIPPTEAALQTSSRSYAELSAEPGRPKTALTRVISIQQCFDLMTATLGNSPTIVKGFS